MEESKRAQNKSSSNAVNRPSGEPTSWEVAAVAYSIWEQEGRQKGHDMDHWLKAETQLRQNRQPDVQAT